MNERVRMQYLDAMGIDMYVPRRILPSAKASVQCELPVEVVRQSASNQEGVLSQVAVGESRHEEKPSSNTSSPSLDTSSIVNELKSVAEDIAHHTSPTKTAEQARRSLQDLLSGREEKAEAVRFTLSLWWTASGVLVVDSREERQALPTVALLSNMLNAVTGDATLPSAEVLKWPLMENTTVPQGMKEAREMVGAFLTSRQSAAPAKAIWVLGQAAIDALGIDGHASPERCGDIADVPSLQLPALLLPSLSDILRQPTCKGLVWKGMQHYHQRITLL